MAPRRPAAPLSLRLTPDTAALLDGAVKRSPETRNAMADRLINEGVRIGRHPLVRFRTGASGRRQAGLVASRLYLHQVIATLRANDDSASDTAEYLGIPESYVGAAIAYYADFKNEVDADAALAAETAVEEQARWERQQQALA